jgi:hypothetical protein
MKFFLAIMLFALVSSYTNAQSAFPESWVGNWKGELQWFRTGITEPQKVNMELRIQKGDSAGNYTWHLVYGSVSEDSRPYVLKAKDAVKGHWVIDELNGIILDQFWVANKFCGAFTVQNSTIVNNYWVEDDKLMIEFYSLGAKPLVTTGLGTEESPKVDSYRVGGYQKAILSRIN